MIASVLLSKPTGYNTLHQSASTMGSTVTIGKTLFTEYIFPFEAVSLLLLAALIGAVILAKRHVKEVES
jgi:NADH-quinone oxidoreductase subunit J